MNKQKIKYFSQLTPKQKDKACQLFTRAKFNLLDLPEGLVKPILNEIDFDKIIKAHDLLIGQKMFYFDKISCFIPLKFSELIKVNI